MFGLSGSAGSVNIAGPNLSLDITHAEPANDTLTLNGAAGEDIVNAGALANDSVLLTVNGGANDDIITGSNGADTINGDAGNDISKAATATTRSTAAPKPTTSTAAAAPTRPPTARRSSTFLGPGLTPGG